MSLAADGLTAKNLRTLGLKRYDATAKLRGGRRIAPAKWPQSPVQIISGMFPPVEDGIVKGSGRTTVIAQSCSQLSPWFPRPSVPELQGLAMDGVEASAFAPEWEQ